MQLGRAHPHDRFKRGDRAGGSRLGRDGEGVLIGQPEIGALDSASRSHLQGPPALSIPDPVAGVQPDGVRREAECRHGGQRLEGLFRQGPPHQGAIVAPLIPDALRDDSGGRHSDDRVKRGARARQGHGDRRTQVFGLQL